MPTDTTGSIFAVNAGATPETATPLEIGISLISQEIGTSPQYVKLPEKAAIGAVVEAYLATGVGAVTVLLSVDESWLYADQAVHIGRGGSLFARKVTETQWGLMISRNL